ncbi:hephaestin [Patella vulgata]|uniref:hephaestin n=1 Tax=Patella vulgata TaxID=6465 RepID=UPI0024A92EB6|nr:hephaestin [Patella vulgata]
MRTHLALCLRLAAIFGICLHVGAVEREYFMASEEVDWNYAPTGANNQNSDKQEYADKFIKNDAHQIGATYRKVVYKHYTDDKYIVEWPKPEHMGLVGPIIRAEVGDVLKIRFKNKATRAYSIYAHGVSYKKPSEGALYMDGSSGYSKEDDVVLPGKVHNYTWVITQGPSESDPPCIPYVYHSHINMAKDTNSGLIGVLLICKKGTLNYDHTRNDVSNELVVLSKAFDENQSWYMDQNLRQCGSIFVCKRTRKMGEIHWVESNIMHSINGRSFSNLEGLATCAGDKVAWYFLSFGDELDAHSIFVEGQVMKIQHQKKSTASVYPGTTEAGFMIAHGPGRYRVSSMMEDHYEDGMSAFFVVNDCLYPNASLPVTTQTRAYFLSIEEDAWDYASSGQDQLTNTTLTEGPISSLFFDKTAKIGGKYIKARYIQYLDQTFTSPIDRKPDEKHMGIMGPVIRVEEGEEVIVHLQNKATKTYSFTAQSLYSIPENSGYSSGLFAGSEKEYRFQVPTNVTRPNDPDCVVRMYYSATDFTRDVNAGLIGPLLICRTGTLKADNQPVNMFKCLSH